MQFTRSRGINRHAQRDFDQERADLLEGYQNQRAVYETNLNNALESTESSGEQKRVLQLYKEAFLQQEADYRADLQRINDEEAQYRAEEGYEGAYVPETQDAADSYCNFADHSEYDASSSAQDYCGAVDFSDGSEENTSESELSNCI